MSYKATMAFSHGDQIYKKGQAVTDEATIEYILKTGKKLIEKGEGKEKEKAEGESLNITEKKELSDNPGATTKKKK